jgi:hypothetical protein
MDLRRISYHPSFQSPHSLVSLRQSKIAILAVASAAIKTESNAHLCPRSELEWFTKQEMNRYNTNQSLSGANLVDDMANALALRSDIHTTFDAGTFVFTRKQDSWVSHFLTPYL